MTRYAFLGDIDSRVDDAAGNPVASRRVRFYADAGKATEYTDLASDAAGTGAPLTVLTNSYGYAPTVYLPDGVDGSDTYPVYVGGVDQAGNPPAFVVRVYSHQATGAGGVASFNSRAGAVTLTKTDVTGTGLTAADVSADASGAAAAVLASSAQKAANLSDLGNAATARTNLGLGTAATHPTTDFDAAGTATSAVATHAAATDPHADRAYTDTKVAALVNSAPALLDTLGEIATQLQSDESAATALTTTVAGKQNVVVHGATAGTARPAGATLVHWVGSVAPTNAATNDEWTDTANKAIKRWNGSAFDTIGSGTSGAAALAPTAVKTSAYTASPSDLVPVDTTSGNVTVTLPTAPADKTVIGVKHVVRGGTNTVTVAAGGADRFNAAGGSATATLALLREAATFQYAAATGLWYAVSNDLPLSQTDLRYDAAGAATTAQSAAQSYAVAQDQALAAILAFGSRAGSVISPATTAPTLGQELWQVANFQAGSNTTTLTPTLTANGTNLSNKTRIFVGNMANSDTSFRLTFDYTMSLNGWGGISVLLTDAGGTSQGGANQQFLVASASAIHPGHVIFDFKTPASSLISYVEVRVESSSNSTTGGIGISNVSFRRTGNELSRPMFVTTEYGASWPDCYIQAWDNKTRNWKIAELSFGNDGSLTPYAYNKIDVFSTDNIFNGGKYGLGDPTFAGATTGVNANPDNPNVTSTRTHIRSNNNDQIIEVWNGTAWELRGNTHSGETTRGSNTLKIDQGSGLVAWTLSQGLQGAQRFQVIMPTAMAFSTGGTFANVDHTFTVFRDGMVRCDRTTTFLQDTQVRGYFEWMSSHPTDRGFLGRLGRGSLVLGDIDTLSKLAVPVAPTLATSTTGGTLPAATYFYKTTKITAYGETTGSPSTSQATTGTASSNTVTFVGDANATGYGIYRGTVSGQETLIGYAPAGATSYVDTNAAVPQPGYFPPTVNKARLYNSAIDTQNIATTDATWAAWYDLQTGWAYGNIYDRDTPLTRSQVGQVRTRLEGATGNIAKNYATLEWTNADSVTIANGTVYTATHYSFLWCPVNGDHWHDQIAARAASLTTLATMYPNT